MIAENVAEIDICDADLAYFHLLTRGVAGTSDSKNHPIDLPVQLDHKLVIHTVVTPELMLVPDSRYRHRASACSQFRMTDRTSRVRRGTPIPLTPSATTGG